MFLETADKTELIQGKVFSFDFKDNAFGFNVNELVFSRLKGFY